ncbi:T9SS type A sorting domain-containing protein [candidate division KSB1 bacterium]|nr:T9SS type A sorting domain-containing protein [candidate division KSB1 bacterium]
MGKNATLFIFLIALLWGFAAVAQQTEIFYEDFEGTLSSSWGLYRADEEELIAVDMNIAPAPLENGGNFVGFLRDLDASYNGAAIAVAGETDLENYYIEADVYCYVNDPGGSAYTGLVVYSDSSKGTYIKLVADFDSDQRFRLYNNRLDNLTFQYTFHHQFNAEDVPGGIPTESGWHHMGVEVQTVNDTTTAYWCYFDGAMLKGCPVYDTSIHQMDAGQFGLFAFQMDADGLAGFFDNVRVQSLPPVVFRENFETGIPSTEWGLFRANEEPIAALEMISAPDALANGGDFVGFIQDQDVSYNGAAIILAGAVTAKNYSIESDVYCYVNHEGGSAYTGLAVYSDSLKNTYIKLAADFDADQRLRFYNNKLDPVTFQYTFQHQFNAEDVPGGIPAESGWHNMKIQAETIDDTTTAFWCYFDGQMLAGCPIYDSSADQMDAGQFGLYAFQMDADGLAGYFDNIVVKGYPSETAVEDLPQLTKVTLPRDAHLLQNYPNPFNPETTISFTLDRTEQVDLTVYDVLGREVTTLVSEIRESGAYHVRWDGLNAMGEKMPSGVYVAALKTASFVETMKMLMMK